MIEYIALGLIVAAIAYAVRKLHMRLKLQAIYDKLLTETDLAKRDELWSQFKKLAGKGK